VAVVPKIGFNEGSLLRRTILHVATFVVGSIAVVSLMSFVLVSVAHSLVSPKPATAATADADEAEPGKPSKPGAPGARPPGAPPLMRKKGALPTAERSKDD
jgi:hypothetical protein